MVFCWLFLSCNFCLRKLASPGAREAYVVIIANFYITSPNLILFGSITPLFMWWVWWVKNFESFIFKTPSWLGN